MDDVRRSGLFWPILASLVVIPRFLAALWRPPWHDEYFSAWAATLPLARLIEALRLDSGPPLPYLLAGWMAPITGSSLSAARAVSLIAGCAAVALLALAGGSGPRGAHYRRAALIVAVHPLCLAWSAEGRAYGLLLLAGCWALWAFDRIDRLGKGYMALGLAVAVGCWSHALGLAVAGALVVAALVTCAPPRRTPTLLGIACGLASWLPWLPVAAGQPAGALRWLAQAWETMPHFERVAAVGRMIPPFAPLGTSGDLPTWPAGLQLVGALLALALVGTARDRRTWLLVGIPALGLAAAALAGVPVVFPGRVEAAYLAPAALLMAGPAETGTWRRAALAACLAGWTVMSAASIMRWSAASPPNESKLVEGIAAALPGGGIVVAGGHWPLGLQFHLNRVGGRWEVWAFPTALSRHPGWQDPASHSPAPGELETLLRRLPPGQVAVVAAPGLASFDSLEFLAGRLGLVPAGQTIGALLYLPRPHHDPPPTPDTSP